MLNLQKKLKSAAHAEGYALEQETKRMKERNKKSVCKTFHGAGMVVPVDANEVGYRPVPETQGKIRLPFFPPLTSLYSA